MRLLHLSRHLFGMVSELPSLLGLLITACLVGVIVVGPASAATDPSLLGDWEVTRVVVKSNDQMKWVLRPDDPRNMWRKYTFDAKSMRMMKETFACEFQKPNKSKAVSAKVLFNKESAQRPPALKGLLDGKLTDFDLGQWKKAALTLYYSQCATEHPNRNETNWIAASATALLMPLANSIVILERPPKAQDAKQSKYCSSATAASERAICADRELWQLRRYALAARRLAAQESSAVQAEMAIESTAQTKVIEACNGNAECLYDALDADVSALVQMRGTGWCGTKAYAPVDGANRCIRGAVDITQP